MEHFAIETALRGLLVAFLAGGAVLKLAGGRPARDALATFGLSDPRARGAVWIGSACVELLLAAGIAFGSDAACFAAALLLSVYALLVGAALAQGKRGRLCGCLGARSRVSAWAVARNLLFASVAAIAPFVSQTLATQSLLAIGLAVALASCCALTVAVAALAREVGEMRLRLGPQMALDIAGEGPERGTQFDVAALFGDTGGSVTPVAIFSSSGCRLCQALEPAVRMLASEPGVAARVFDEVEDADTWSLLNIPGSPYAVVFDASGAVADKGTFNNYGQLLGMLASASVASAPATAHA